MLSKTTIVVFGLLLLSLLFRFPNLPSHVEFLGDQGRDARIMRDLLAGNLVFIGPQTSVGNMYLGPWFYYFMAPSLALFNLSPLGPAFFTATLGVITVLALFYMCLDLFGNLKIATLTALLFSLSPTVIRYTLFSWNPNIMPLFSLVFFWSFYRALFTNQPKFLIISSLSFIMCFNSHYLALSLLPIAFLMLVYRFTSAPDYLKSRRFLIYLLLAFFLFLVSLLPLVLFDLKHSGQNSRAILKFFTERETTVNLKFYKGLFKIPELLSLIFTSLLGSGNGLLTAFVSAILSLVWILKFKALKFLRPSAVVSVLLFVLLSIVFLGLYKQHVYDHYFGFLFPLIFILIGLPLGFLLSEKQLLPRLLSLGITGLVMVNFIARTPLLQSPVHQVSRSREVAEFIAAKSRQRPYNLALIAHQNYDSPYRYFLELSQSPVKLINESVTDQLFVICEPWGLDSCNPINHPFYDIAAFGWSKIDQTWEVSGVKIFRLVPNPTGQTQST